MSKLAASAAVVFLLLTVSHGHLPKLLAAPAPAGHGSNEQLANQMAASGYGWRGSQAACLDALWTEESGFSATAHNNSSGATGIPQLLPSVHRVPPNWPDPRVQIRWGLGYIRGRYGTPCAAWAFERSHTPNWY
jgi:hypothetical protein